MKSDSVKCSVLHRQKLYSNDSHSLFTLSPHFSSIDRFDLSNLTNRANNGCLSHRGIKLLMVLVTPVLC